MRKEAVLSITFFILLMFFSYYSPIERRLVMWSGTRAFIPWVVSIIMIISAYFSFVYLKSAYVNRKAETVNLLFSIPILLYLVYKLILLIYLSMKYA